MHGPTILTTTISVPMARGSRGDVWQYNSRSDHHSKVACWAVLFDLLRESAVLANQAAAGDVVLGINFSITNFQSGRKKNLDLVVAKPEKERAGKRQSFRGLVDKYDIVLDDTQRAELESLPDIDVGEFGANAVRIALEAKACMTEHGKAGPRLFDELNSSHQIVHAASEGALAVGFAMINAAPTFVSSVLNPRMSYDQAQWTSTNPQPKAAIGAAKRIQDLPRRSGSTGVGYDGLAMVLIDMVNDGTPATLVSDPPAPKAGDALHYDAMIHRVANEYDARFKY